MALSIRALGTGHLHGLHKPAITYMRGWGSMHVSPVIMFVTDGGGAPIIESLDCQVIPSHDVAVLKKGRFA